MVCLVATVVVVIRLQCSVCRGKDHPTIDYTVSELKLESPGSFSKSFLRGLITACSGTKLPLCSALPGWNNVVPSASHVSSSVFILAEGTHLFLPSGLCSHICFIPQYGHEAPEKCDEYAVVFEYLALPKLWQSYLCR